MSKRTRIQNIINNIENINDRNMVKTKQSASTLSKSTSRLLLLLFAFNNVEVPSSFAYNSPEPSFPQLFDPLKAENGIQVHIVCETVSYDGGYESTEEFVDLELGKHVYIARHESGTTVSYLDASKQVAYLYQPYSCIRLDPSKPMAGHEGLLSTQVRFGFGSGEDSSQVGSSSSSSLSSTTNEGDRMLRLYGVAAIWSNAAKSSKSYSNSTIIYTISKAMYRHCIKWTVKDKHNNNFIHLFFSEGSNGEFDILEMVQIQSIAGDKIFRIYNILSIERSIPEEASGLFAVPIGFGCNDGRREAQILRDIPLINFSTSEFAHKISLEASASNLNNATAQTADLMSIEIIRAPIGNDNGKGRSSIQLLRQRNNRKDLKEVIHHAFQVRYQIDMRAGVCKIDHFEDATQEGLNVEFSNGLRLDFSLQTIQKLFFDLEGFALIKRFIVKPSMLKHVYIERSSKNLIEGKDCRIIRSYVEQEFSDGNDEDGSGLQLDSVAIWVFNELHQQVLEIYHFNVIELAGLDSNLELAKLFDLSDECYLSSITSSRSRVGREFAWLELTYPLPAHQVDIVASRSVKLKELVYEHLQDAIGLDFFRMPRIELEPSAEIGLIMRLLLLDLPPLETLYKPLKETSFSLEASSIGGEIGDLKELAADLSHCSELCRLNGCKTMSFCESDHTCLISRRIVANDSLLKENEPSCTTYRQSKTNLEPILQLGLHKLIGRFKHEDYGALAMPRMPDELAYPRSETGISFEDHRLAAMKYMKSLHDLIDKESSNPPTLLFSLMAKRCLVVFLPSKFEVLHDPLNQFDAAASSFLTAGIDNEDELGDNMADNIILAFHEGMPLHKLKLEPDEAGKTGGGRRFMGLNYEQCALACIDAAKCSAFSYCIHDRECIITESALTGSTIERDDDCFVYQHDFLSKFNKFSDVRKPKESKRSQSAYSATDCAQHCLMEANFTCLAFDYCAPTENERLAGNQLGTCFYLSQRFASSSESLQAIPKNSEMVIETSQESSTQTCNHYSRSYLADFLRFEHHQIHPMELQKLSTSTIEGLTVDNCAEHCAMGQYSGCSAFQFCFEPLSVQSCTIIEPETGESKHVTSNKTGKENKFFQASDWCHVFALRQDTSEAKLRRLILEAESGDDGKSGSESGTKTITGLSMSGAITLFLLLSCLFGAVICALLLLATSRNAYLRYRIERAWPSFLS